MSNLSIRRHRMFVSAAVTAAMLVGAVAEVAAAPTPVAPGQGAAIAAASGTAPVEAGFVRNRNWRHGHGIDGGGALVLGIVGLGIAAAIAANNHPRRYYDQPAYYPADEPAYQPAYEPGYYEQPYYAQPQVTYAPQQPYYSQPYYQPRRHHGFFERHHWQNDGYQHQDERRFETRSPPVAYQPQPQVIVQQRPPFESHRGGWPHVGGGRGHNGGAFACEPGQLCGPHN